MFSNISGISDSAYLFGETQDNHKKIQEIVENLRNILFLQKIERDTTSRKLTPTEKNKIESHLKAAKEIFPLDPKAGVLKQYFKRSVEIGGTDEITLLHDLCNAHITKIKFFLEGIEEDDLESIVNQTSEKGWTPLMVAILADKLDVVKYLIAKKADVNQANKENNLTPLSLCLLFGRNEMYKLLEKKTMLISRELFLALTEEKTREFIKEIKDKIKVENLWENFCADLVSEAAAELYEMLDLFRKNNSYNDKRIYSTIEILKRLFEENNPAVVPIINSPS